MRKKPRRRASGPNWGLIAGAMVGAVAIAIGGFLAYKLTRPRPDAAATGTTTTDKAPTGTGKASTDADKSLTAPHPSPFTPTGILPTEPLLPPEPPLPDGWRRVVAKNVNLSAHWPGEPSEHEETESDMGIDGPLRVKNRGYDYSLPGQGGGFELDVMVLPSGAPLNDVAKGVFLRLPRHQIVRLGKGQVTAERVTTLAGAPATEFEFTAAGITGVYRYAFVRAGGKSLFVMAKAAGPKIDPAERQAFLDSIRPAGR